MRTLIVFLTALALLGASLLVFAQSPAAAARLDEARRMETLVSLDKAIEAYKRIPEDFPNDKPAGAKAYLRIVKLNDFLGSVDAMRDACQVLLNVYAGQPEVNETGDLCQNRTRPGIFIAKMDPQTGVIPKQQPRSITENPRDTEIFPTFSPDGGLLGFTRIRPNTKDQAIVRSLSDKSERTLKGCGTATVGGVRLMWLPDQSVLLVNTLAPVSMPPNEPHCFGFHDSRTGELRRTIDPGGQALASAWSALSPDGKTLHTILPGAAYFRRPTTALVSFNLEKEDVNDSIFILPFRPFRGAAENSPNWYTPMLAISPDGQTAVYLANPLSQPDSRLVSFATDGADRHYKELFIAATQIKGVAFSRDGKRIFFGVADDSKNWDSKTWRIMQMPAGGGPVSFTGLEITGMAYFEPNRANTEIAFDGLSYTLSAPGPYTPPPVPAPAAPAPAPRGARGNRGGHE
jgi:hypothetical protein